MNGRRVSWFPSPLRMERLGVAIVADAICACLVRGGVVVWTQQLLASSHDLLEAPLRHLLSTCPAARLARRRARVAIGPSRVITKRLTGVDAPTSAERAAAVVSAPERHFILPHGVPSVSALYEPANGDVWASAFVRADLEAIGPALRASGWRHVDIVPAVTIVPAGHVLHDGPRSIVVTSNDETRFDLAAHAAEGEPGASDVVSMDGEALAELAARHDAPMRMAARPEEDAESLGRDASWRFVRRMLSVAALAFAGMTVADVLQWRSDLRAVASSAAVVRMVESQRDSAIARERQLLRLEQFIRRHPVTVRRLADFAIATDTAGTIDRLVLGDTVAELSMRVTRGAEVPGVLGAIPWVREARLVGSVARDGGDTGLERIALRLSLHRAPAGVVGPERR